MDTKKKRHRLTRIVSFVAALALIVGCLYHPMSAYGATSSTYYIKVNRTQNCITVYTKDSSGNYTVPVRAMICSTGADGATPIGVYSIGTKYRWHELMGGVYGQYCSRIVGGILFHSVYYHTTDPSQLYYDQYNKLGSSVSHGCIRLTVEDAKWIYDNCPSGTKVEVYESSDPGPLGKPSAYKISSSSPNRGWDPTDPDTNNPWSKTSPTISGVTNKTVERGSSSSVLLSGVSAKDGVGESLTVTTSGSYNLSKEGKYTVTYKATDRWKHTVTKTATITVKDTTAPTVAVKQSTLSMNDTLTFSSKGELKRYLKNNYVTAADSGTTLTYKNMRMNMGGLWNAYDKGKSGTYTVTVRAEDDAGNSSSSKTFTVKYTADKAKVTAKKSSIKLSDSKVTFESKDEMKDYLLDNVTATFRGQTLSDKKITIKLGGLWDAYKKGKSGTYTVTAYATRRGVKSEKISFDVTYTAQSPKVELSTKQVTLDPETQEFETKKELKAYVKSLVTATYRGSEMGNSKIHVDVDELWAAYQNGESGTYDVEVYAETKWGLDSGVKTVKVSYVAPDPETVDADEDEDAETDGIGTAGEDAGSADALGEEGGVLAASTPADAGEGGEAADAAQVGRDDADIPKVADPDDVESDGVWSTGI